MRLRIADRRELHSHLAALDHPSEAIRAAAALSAATLLRDRSVNWVDLIPIDPKVAEAWRHQATALLGHPDVTPAEQRFLRKILGWKAPGAGGATQLQVIIDRILGLAENDPDRLLEVGEEGALDPPIPPRAA